MEITHGLLAGQVLQRNNENNGYTLITGTCDSVGSVEIRVQEAGKVLRHHEWQHVGDAMENCFFAELNSLKTGGPYTVKLRIRKAGKTLEKLSVKEIFVGDVWFLAGQSNMEGVGHLKDAPKPHEKVRAFYMRDEWGIAEKKLHFLGEAVDSVHNGYGEGPDRPPQEKLDKILSNQVKGLGPGNAFGLDMYKRTKVPQGLVSCAHGGTSMAQWSPDLRDKGGASLYGAMMRRFDKLGQPIAGVLWYQGESDANTEAANIYTEKMVELVESTRTDMYQPDLPWFIVQLGCHTSPDDASAWNSVQEQQRLLPGVIKHLDVASAVDLCLDDGIHISGKSQCVLGKRLARLADSMVHKNKKAKPGIALKRIQLVKTPDCDAGANSYAVELTYSNVAGKLVADGRPTGFNLFNNTGSEVGGIFRISLHGNKVLLHTNMLKYQLGPMKVSYGHGRHPYCNIVDSENMSIPVIRALDVEPDRMQAIGKWQTVLLPGVTSVSRTGYAKAKAAKGWRKAPARIGFGVLPKVPSSNQLGVYVLRTSLKSREDLEALLVFGANAPFKIWLNGKVLLTDTQARAPLNPDQYKQNVSLKKGQNEIMVAFGISTPAGRIGIMSRIGTPEEKAEPRITC